MIIPTIYGMLLMLLIAGVRKYDVFISMQNMVDSYPQNNRNAFDNNSIVPSSARSTPIAPRKNLWLN